MAALPYVEVNASSVVENPRESSYERSTNFSMFGALGLGRRSLGAPRSSTSSSSSAHAPMHAVPHAEITASDFLGYISQLRAARRKAKLDAEAAEAADYTADLECGFPTSPMFVSTGAAMTMSTPTKRGILAPFLAGATPRSAEFISAGADAFDAVPARFFDQEYSIQAPGVFVSLLTSTMGTDDVQDSLTSYLDLVECQLLASIQARAGQFFEALTDLQALRERVVAGNLVASQMRRTLAALKQKNCEQPLLMMAMHRRRRRKTSVREVLSLMRDACAAPAIVSAAIRAGDINGALDAIGAAQALVRGQLGHVVSLAPVRQKLENSEAAIGTDLTKRFSRSSITLIVVGAVDVEAGGGGGVRSAAFDAALQTTVRPLVDGLVRVRRLVDGLEAMQADLVSELKEVVRSEVVEAVRAADAAESPLMAGGTQTVGEGSASAERLQSLSPSAFVSVLSAVCGGLLDLLMRLQAVHELVENVLDVSAAAVAAPAAAEVTSAAGTDKTAPWSRVDAVLGLGALRLGGQSAASLSVAAAERQIEVQRWRAVASGVLAVAMDAAQRHVARLLGTRREQSLRLRIADIRRLWDTATGFAIAANTILTRASAVAALSASASASAGVVWEECLSQVRMHLHHVHAQNSEALTELLDVEQWKQADVPQQVQVVADAIAAAVTVSSSSSSVAPSMMGTAGNPQRVADSANGPLLLLANQRESSRTLISAGTAYPFVASGVMLVKMLGDYSSVAEAFPESSAEAISCTVLLLRLFNERATSLVLGAGALQSAARLKRITAKHLALTSQTLGGILALLPALRAMLLMRLPPHQHVLLSEMAAVTADLIAHDNRIRAKLVSIVKDLMVKCCADMGAISWGNPHIAQSLPSPPMSEFITGVTTLHHILGDTLRREQLADVYSRILLMANAHLPSQYAALIAKLATAAAAAAAALVAPPMGNVVPRAIPVFDRAVAVERMGGDLRVLMAQLDALRAESSPTVMVIDDCTVTANEKDKDTLHDSVATDQASIEALASLTRWIERDFLPRTSDSGTSAAAEASPVSVTSAAEEGSDVAENVDILIVEGEGGGDEVALSGDDHAD